MSVASRPPAHLVLGALITVQILFGLNYIISKEVVAQFHPLVWSSIRAIISAATIMLIAKGLKKPHPTSSGFYKKLIIFSLLGIIINQASFLVGLKITSPTNASVLNTLIPVFTLIIVIVRGHEKATFRRILGFISALAGVLLLLKVEELDFSSETLVGDGLMILNCLSYGFFLAYSKKFFEENDRLWATGWLFLYGSVGLTTIAMPHYISVDFPVMTGSLWAAAVFAIIGGTLLTYFLNNWALAYTKSSNVAIFIYIQPVVTVLLAWAFQDQVPTARTILSTGFIFAGIFMSVVQVRGTKNGSQCSNY